MKRNLVSTYIPTYIQHLKTARSSTSTLYNNDISISTSLNNLQFLPYITHIHTQPFNARLLATNQQNLLYLAFTPYSSHIQRICRIDIQTDISSSSDKASRSPRGITHSHLEHQNPHLHRKSQDFCTPSAGD